MRKQKDEELEHYKKEIERAKRFESQKLAGGAAGLIEKITVKKVVNGGGGKGGPIQKVRLNK